MLKLHMLESRLKEEDYMLIKAKCKFLSTYKIRACGDMRKSVSPILVYGGAMCESSPSGAQSRKVTHLRVDQDRYHLAQVECARKRYVLDMVSILPVLRCSWKTGF